MYQYTRPHYGYFKDFYDICLYLVAIEKYSIIYFSRFSISSPAVELRLGTHS
jgi:hypothetical protein